MKAEEELLRDYQKNRAELEEQEDTVKRYIRKGQDYTQEIFFQVRQILGKRSTSMESIMETQRELQRNEDHYLEELAQERKALILQQEEVEQFYRKKRQELTK
ncbi:hypothetical protein UAW_03054 [Enterococcus haemoperoxidus ATCC BAA-382]|uniref:Uncharacterized protein n=1 Tax=Enterococcus haemoperoxidus ATCC BAA-382 TaxID=1158608 RepID=R2SWF5_9ENTE|nr:hypothetical protein [Enterococcus haemoperoxidus]EOH92389.1 hypothetical protein UAW_03054 [Enterococcus haemoperoxidus ATCC BAA-382]EOT61755.1 hypothetical protein I583_00737 [Enterococcus haemoperoxidus ATCC BAA-382]OJG53971.1 hypothetical protein RV06_GL000590 [Enterococcus haemoperoxidus]